MLETLKRRQGLVALALLALSVVLALSLLSYNPADGPTSLVYPPGEETQNACGPVGAFAARALLTTLGVGAYALVLSGMVLAVLLLRGLSIEQPLTRLLGWLLMLLGLTTVAALLGFDWSSYGAIGPGGYLGAAGRGLVESQFATAGAYLVTLAVFLGGMLLCTDLWAFRLAGWSAGATLKAGRGVMAVARRSGNRGAAEEADDLRISRKSRKGNLNLRNDLLSAADLPNPGLTDATELSGDEGGEEDGREGTGGTPVAPESVARLRIRNRLTKLTERQAVMAQLEAASHLEDAPEYELPPIDLLQETEPFSFEQQEQEVRHKAKTLERTFSNFGFNVKVVEIETGPVISQYEVELEAGLRVSKITGLADDLAVALRVPSVRIVAPIPGKNTVGCEVPNAERQMVRLREVMEEAAETGGRFRIPLYLGKDVSGNPLVVDLTTLPHLLIAGRTGTGKSVCLNTIIMSILMTRRPDEVKLLLVDPKMVELTPYARLPHLMHNVVTDMKKAEAILAWAVEKMEERYALLMRAGVRHVEAYNQLSEEELMERLQPENEEQREQIPTHLPYIVMVADEMADLIMSSPKEVESHIIRLAQKSRAVGIHLVLATQKPTVNVITGLIKSNLPARIAFQVASRTDSRVVLDEMGADKLLGTGDMLYLSPGTSTLLRGQGAFVSDDEIRQVVGFLATHEPQFATELVQLRPRAGDGAGGLVDHKDELYAPAVELVLREGRGSVSLLQRALGIGYGRAARLIDYMAEDGLVGPYNGSQAREVLVSLSQWQQLQQRAAAKGAAGGAGAGEFSRPRPNRLVLKTASPVEEEEEEEEGPLDEGEEEEAIDAEGEMDEEFDEEEESDEEERGGRYSKETA